MKKDILAMTVALALTLPLGGCVGAWGPDVPRPVVYAPPIYYPGPVIYPGPIAVPGPIIIHRGGGHGGHGGGHRRR